MQDKCYLPIDSTLVKSVLVSYCGCSKLPETWWIKEIQMYHPIVLQVKSAKWIGKAVLLLKV